MPSNAKEMTLAEKVNAAMHLVAADVIERARQTGTPVIVWENDRITERSPEELLGNFRPENATDGR